MRFIRIFLVMAVVAVLGGCVSKRSTTTDRTAIEQALIMRTAEAAIDKFETPEAAPKGTIYLIREDFKSVDDERVLSALGTYFLRMGYQLTDNLDEADQLVMPRTDFVGIDDTSTMIGIPEVALPVPGLGEGRTPELALYKKATQRGRISLAYVIYDPESGDLIYEQPARWAERFYTRWTVLLFIGFRTSNLEEPF